MTVKRYLLLNLGIAALSGIFNGPALIVWEAFKRIRKTLRYHRR
jgi:hypothetical protein